MITASRGRGLSLRRTSRLPTRRATGYSEPLAPAQERQSDRVRPPRLSYRQIEHRLAVVVLRRSRRIKPEFSVRHPRQCLVCQVHDLSLCIPNEGQLKPLLAEQSGQSIMESTTSVRNGEFACEPGSAPPLVGSSHSTPRRPRIVLRRPPAPLARRRGSHLRPARPAGGSAFGQSGRSGRRAAAGAVDVRRSVPGWSSATAVACSSTPESWSSSLSRVRSGKSVGRKRLGLAQPPLGWQSIVLRGCLELRPRSSSGYPLRACSPGQLPHLALGGLQFLGQSPFLGLSVLPRGFFRYSVLTASRSPHPAARARRPGIREPAGRLADRVTLVSLPAAREASPRLSVYRPRSRRNAVAK